VRGREFNSLKLYIPGYIFVRFDVEADEWFPINWTRGIRHLISASPEKPIPVRDILMSLLLDRCDEDGYVLEKEADQALEWLRVGRRVRVNKGACEGLSGVVTWKDGDRVKLLLSFLGSTRPVEVHAKSLEAVV
jgi:transcription antitermination factor NusG